MKSPFEHRWFCFIVSVMSAYLIYADLTKDHKVNFLNLLWFVGTTYLFFSKTKPNNSNKKHLFTETKENQEDLKILKTFKK